MQTIKMNQEIIKNWISLFIFLILFAILFDARASSTMRCERKPKDVFYVLLDPPAAEASLWSVRFFKYNSATSQYGIEDALHCDFKKESSVEPQEHVVTRCQVIFGPDGGEDLLVVSNRKDGSVYVAYVPWGPTGRGRREVLNCSGL